MDTALLLLLPLLILHIYLVCICAVVLMLDDGLRWYQKLLQLALSLLIPLIGPLAVLHFAYTCNPFLLKWVPWPFRAVVVGKEIKKYSSEEDQSTESTYGT